jgi:hypothetical protein
METFILNVRNKAIAKDLESYLFKFGNSIKLIRLPNPNNIIRNNKSSVGNSFDIAGIWEGSDITIQKIRDKAWRKI